MAIDLPDPDALVVSLADLAAASGLDVDGDAAALTAACLDAQSDVEAFLGRVIVPTAFTVTGVPPGYAETWSFTAEDDPMLGIHSATAELDVNDDPTGYYTLVYVAGIDAATDGQYRPIRRYVKAAAVNSPEILRLYRLTGARGPIKSASTEGQSVSYEAATHGGGGAAGSYIPGSLPTLGSLDRWRVAGRRVFQRRGTTFQRPYDAGLGL